MDTAIGSAADLGRAVRSTRKALGLTQDVLAAAASVGPRFIVDLEAGKPTVQLDKVCAVLGAIGFDLCLKGKPR